MCVCISIYLSLYLPIYSSIVLSIALSFYLSIYHYLSFYRFIVLSIYRSIDLSITQFITLSIYRSIFYSITLSIYLVSVCVCVHAQALITASSKLAWACILSDIIQTQSKSRQRKRCLVSSRHKTLCNCTHGVYRYSNHTIETNDNRLTWPFSFVSRLPSSSLLATASWRSISIQRTSDISIDR